MEATVYRLSHAGKSRFHTVKRFVANPTNNVTEQSVMAYVKQDKELRGYTAFYRLDVTVKKLTDVEVRKGIARSWLRDFGITDHSKYYRSHRQDVDRTLKLCKRWYGKRRQFSVIYQASDYSWVFGVPIDDPNIVIRIK